MYYYPKILPIINLSKLNEIKHRKSETTMLYSSEGLFQIRKGNLYQVHFLDSIQSEKRKINAVEYICDDSIISWSPSHKLPFEFNRSDIIEFCYEYGSVKFYVHQCEGKIIHAFFYIKDDNIYEIEEDIANLMARAQS